MDVVHFLGLMVSSGFMDAFNPLMLINLTMITVLGSNVLFSFNKHRFLFALFMSIYITVHVLILSGFAVSWYLSPVVTHIMRAWYLIAGIVMLTTAIILLRTPSFWQRLFPDDAKKLGIVNVLLMMVLSFVLSLGITFWPPDSNVTLVANYLLMPGYYSTALGLLSVYVIVMSWPLLLGMVLAHVLNKGKLLRFIITAMLLLSGVVGIYIF